MLILSKKKIERFCVLICVFNECERITEIVKETKSIAKYRGY